MVSGAKLRFQNEPVNYNDLSWMFSIYVRPVFKRKSVPEDLSELLLF